MPFSELITLEELNKSLKECDYRNPTPIQEKVIPLVLEKKILWLKLKQVVGKPQVLFCLF